MQKNTLKTFNCILECCRRLHSLHKSSSKLYRYIEQWALWSHSSDCCNTQHLFTMHPNFLHCKTVGWDCEHLLNQLSSINSKIMKTVYFDAMLCIRKKQSLLQFKKKKNPRPLSSWTSQYGMDANMLKIKRKYYNSRKRTSVFPYKVGISLATKKKVTGYQDTAQAIERLGDWKNFDKFFIWRNNLYKKGVQMGKLIKNIQIWSAYLFDYRGILNENTFNTFNVLLKASVLVWCLVDFFMILWTWIL